MAGESDLGDLIVTLKLDDAQYRQDIKEAVYLTTESIKKIQAELAGEKSAHLQAASAAKVHAGAIAGLGGKVLSATSQISVINAKAQEAHQRFGVMANAVTGASTVLRLFGAAEAMVIVETGRVILYLGRATTAAGGFAAALIVIKAATLSFIASLPPLAIAIAAIATAMAAAKAIFDAGAEAEERAEKRASERRDRMEEEAAAIRQRNSALRDAEDAFAVAKGVMSEQTAQELRLLRGGTPPEDAEKLAQLADDTRVWLQLKKELNEQWELGAKQEEEAREHLNKRILAEMGFHAKRVELEREADEKIAENSYKAFIKGNKAIERANRDSMEELQQLAIEFGGRKPSDFLTGQARDRALFGEAANLRLKNVTEESGFGIGTLPSSGFRFGAGAIGSVIGEQTEQKKTTEAVERLRQTIITEFNQKFGTSLNMQP
jgi:hypothetical protein